MTAALTDILWTVAGFQFNTVDSNGVMWAVDVAGTQGWYDGPTLRLNQTPIPRYDGGYDADSYRNPRMIVIPGWAAAPNKALAQQARDQFQGMFSLGHTPVTLTVTDGGQTYTMLVKLGDQPKSAPFPNGVGFVWQLTLTAIDPRKYGATVTVHTGLPTASGVGLDWGTGGSTGLDWGTGGSTGLDWGTTGLNGVVTVTNMGTADAWPVFTIAGPVTNPSITDASGNVLQYTGSVASGVSLVITTSPFGPRSVLLGGSADVRSNLTTAQWAPVADGSSQSYQFQGSSAGSPLLTVSLPSAYW